MKDLSSLVFGYLWAPGTDPHRTEEQNAVTSHQVLRSLALAAPLWDKAQRRVWLAKDTQDGKGNKERTEFISSCRGRLT